MFVFKCVLVVVALAALAKADDPADSWLSYAGWTAAGNARITSLNTTFVVPSDPKTWGRVSWCFLN